MKLKYYLMSLVMASAALTGFTSCSDDDDAPAELTFSGESMRVKIGEENKVAVPIATGGGQYNAFSLDEEIAKTSIENGKVYVEGLKNGSTKIVVSDASNNYKQFLVSVYTTEVVKLNYSTLELTTIVGKRNTVTGIAVTEGNDKYTVESNDERVSAAINSETGEITVYAAAEEDPYTAVLTVADQTNLTAELTVNVSEATDRVKIGTDTRELLPIDKSLGEYTVELVNDGDKATLYTDDSGEYIEGLANGTAIVKILQGENYRQLTYSVYTTDVMKLSATTYKLESPLGVAATVSPISVIEGNGGYSIVSDNEAVYAAINSTTGAITLTVKSKVDDYDAVITVTDCTGLTASATISVIASLDPFTSDELDNIKAITKNTLWIQANEFSQNVNSDFSSGYERDGDWVDAADSEGNHTFGWWEIYWGTDYGGHYIIYPEGTSVGQEVDATYRFRYNAWGSSTYNLSGKAKIVQDDETKKVVIWWNVDLEKECINRGWIVKMK